MFTRRRFLQTLGALTVSTRLHAQTFPFALGVASGYPSADGVVLWTRLTGPLDPLAVPVRWEIAADEAMKTIVMSGTAQAEPAWAHSVHVQVRGLVPERWYWYRFTAAGGESAVGRTRTAPLVSAPNPRLRLAFASCQQYEQGYFNA